MPETTRSARNRGLCTRTTTKVFKTSRRRPLRYKGEPVRDLFDAPSAQPVPTDEPLLPSPNAAHGVLDLSQLTEGAHAAIPNSPSSSRFDHLGQCRTPRRAGGR